MGVVTSTIRSRGLRGWESEGESISMLSAMKKRQNRERKQHRELEPNPEASLPRVVVDSEKRRS